MRAWPSVRPAKLDWMGYDTVAVMAGGSKAWAAAGFELFTGVNVPSKAFGELVEHRCGTPHIPAAELKRRLDFRRGNSDRR